MELDERARHEMYDALEDLMGPTVTDTLMAHLPPSGWGDVATKQDLALLEARIQADLHRELASLHRELASLSRTMIGVMVSAILASVGLSVTLAQLLG